MLRIADFKTTLFSWFFLPSRLMMMKTKMMTSATMTTEMPPMEDTLESAYFLYIINTGDTSAGRTLLAPFYREQWASERPNGLFKISESTWWSGIEIQICLIPKPVTVPYCPTAGHHSSLIHRKFLHPLVGSNYSLSKEECAGLSSWHWLHLTGNVGHLKISFINKHLYNACHVPGTGLSRLQILTHLWQTHEVKHHYFFKHHYYYYYSSFMDKETKVQRS